MSKKRGKAQARRLNQADKSTTDAAAKTQQRTLVSLGLSLGLMVGLVSVVLPIIARGSRTTPAKAKDPALTSSSATPPVDDHEPPPRGGSEDAPDLSDGRPPKSVENNPDDFLLFSLHTAAERGDVTVAQHLAEEALQSSTDARFLRRAADALYRNDEPPLLDLSVSLLRKVYDLSSESSVPDRRRATDGLGRALERRGDSDEADALFATAVRDGLWGLPDQRPQHYFPFIQAGPPFPHAEDYAGPIRLLEDNFESIRSELIWHKKFPGHFTTDTEFLATNGRWLQADFLFRREWHEQHVKQFPKTAAVLREISDQYATDLPEAVMQMSTMVKGTRVRPHCGSGNHKVRLHLGLYVPKATGVKCKNETSHWEVGKVLVLDDSYVHSVWNNSPEPRTVLIVDVWANGISEAGRDVVRKHFKDREMLLSMARRNQPT